MDLRLLEYFLAVAKVGNITKAAQQLHVTQPTISRQLADLEELLGVTLLVRGKRRITLTEAGVLFQQRAEEILGRVRPDTLLVSIMHVNNETGTIQPVHEIGEALKGTEVYFHVDASQSCGKLVEELRDLSYDLLSVSAHKMYGPQGVGALVIKNKNGNLSALKPIMFGGGQERGMRPGTLPAALIGGMGEAADILVREYKYTDSYGTIYAKFAEDSSPLDNETGGYSSKFSRAYIRHLVKANEMLACTLISMHNIRFFQNLMQKAREAIECGNYEQWSAETTARYESSENDK